MSAADDLRDRFAEFQDRTLNGKTPLQVWSDWIASATFKRVWVVRFKLTGLTPYGETLRADTLARYTPRKTTQEVGHAPQR